MIAVMMERTTRKARKEDRLLVSKTSRAHLAAKKVTMRLATFPDCMNRTRSLSDMVRLSVTTLPSMMVVNENKVS